MIDTKYSLTFHHTGCLTKSIEHSKKEYAALGFHKSSETYIIHEQKVKVCFIEMSDGVFLELVEPSADNDPLKKLLQSKVTFYHLGFLTDDYEKTISQLENDGFYLINSFRSEAFSNRLCAFFYTRDMNMIEIIQK